MDVDVVVAAVVVDANVLVLVFVSNNSIGKNIFPNHIHHTPETSAPARPTGFNGRRF